MLYAQDNNNLLLVATNENKLINVVKQIKESNSNIKIEYLIADLSKQEDR